MDDMENISDSEVIDERRYTTSDRAILHADQLQLLKKAKVNKKTYYPMQECLAENIVNRIKTILWLYSKKTLSDFSSFDFQIYTARYNMLEDQTLHRLLEPEASCFQRYHYDDFNVLKQMATDRISKYQKAGKEKMRLAEIKKRAKNDEDTLFLIIADEAHWGVGKLAEDDKKQPTGGPEHAQCAEQKQSKKAANDQLINCWTNDQPNVIVLLVTATGFNLKTQGSCLPDQEIAVLRQEVRSIRHHDTEEVANQDYKYTTHARPVEKHRNIYIDTEDRTIHYNKDRVERTFSLHNVRWTEGHKDKIMNGMLVKMRLPHKKTEQYHWLMISEKQNEHNLYQLEVTSDKEQSVELLIEGSTEDKVEIKSEDGSNQLIVLEFKQHGISKYELGFVDIDQLGDWDENNQSKLKTCTFSMKMDCGEDLLVIQVNDDSIPNATSCLWYQREHDRVVLHRPPADLGKVQGLVLTFDLEYMFLIDYYKGPEQLSKTDLNTHHASMKCHNQFPPEYLSLNFYYNSMRNELTEEKLIRGDRDFNNMLKSHTKAVMPKSQMNKLAEVDDLGYAYLAADYSYYILLMEDIRNCTQFAFRSFQEVLLNHTKALGTFNDIRSQRIQCFTQRLDNYVTSPKLKVISSKVFMSVVDYHQKMCSDILDNLADDKRAHTPDFVLQQVLKCLLYLHAPDDSVVEKFHMIHNKLCCDNNKEQELQKSFFNLEFETTKREILEQSETYKIMNRLIGRSDQNRVLDGKMVVVRLPFSQTSKKNIAPPGNIFYATLCEARIAGMNNSSDSFKFELVRDFGDYKLKQISEDIETAQYRLHYQLQPKVCEHRDEVSLQRCFSGHQGRPCSQLKIDQDAIHNLQCSNCHHRHRNITCYEDLNTLPCILILVSKGRLGDTFPDSFFAMDLRLTSDGKPPLSTIMQELGRLCRYAEKPSGPNATDEYLKLPYALIAPGLNEYLSAALEKYPNFSGQFSVDQNLDMHLPTRKKATKTASVKQGNAIETNAIANIFHQVIGETQNLSSKKARNAETTDYEDDKVKHKFRLLLEAEPQIGKTGVYLKTISLLRSAIEGDMVQRLDYELDDCPGIQSEEEDAEEEMIMETNAAQDDPEVAVITDDAAEKWKYPYWETMKSSKFKDVAPHSGKYARTHGSKPLSSNYKQKSSIKKKLIPAISAPFIESSNTYKAYSKEDPEHLSCSKCRPDVGRVILTEWIDNRKIEISIPTTRSYLSFFQELGYDNIHVTDTTPMTMMTDASDLTQADLINARTLHTWIFTPSYKRCRDATVNYRHTMVYVNKETLQKKKCYFQHFLVVREEDFSAYCSCWDRTHIIIQMPFDMEGIEDDINIKTGGIGYARLFIQRFARHYNQTRIFMIDDNIPKVHEINVMANMADGKEYVVRKGKSLDMKSVPLFKVLKHMEQLFIDGGSDCRMNLHHLEGFEPHPDEEEGTIQSYTGPNNQYGVMGMLNWRKGILRVKNPFKKTHVFAMVLLNLQALDNANIEYKPSTTREDISLNQACTGKNNLWVCKYNRFIMSKLQLRSTIIPSVYTWPDDVIMALSTGKQGPKKVKIRKAPNSLDLLYHYIRVERSPGRVELYPKGSMGNGEVKLYHEKFIKSKPGLCHLLIFAGKKIEDLNNYFSSTCGIGGFKEHLLLLPEIFFKQYNMVRRSNYEEHIIKRLFKDVEDFDVCTSHCVQSFKVPFVLVYILGKIVNPADNEGVNNVTGQQIVCGPRTCRQKQQISDTARQDVTMTAEASDMHRTSDQAVDHDADAQQEQTKLAHYEGETNVNAKHVFRVELNDVDQICLGHAASPAVSDDESSIAKEPISCSLVVSPVPTMDTVPSASTSTTGEARSPSNQGITKKHYLPPDQDDTQRFKKKSKLNEDAKQIREDTMKEDDISPDEACQVPQIELAHSLSEINTDLKIDPDEGCSTDSDVSSSLPGPSGSLQSIEPITGEQHIDEQSNASLTASEEPNISVYNMTSEADVDAILFSDDDDHSILTISSTVTTARDHRPITPNTDSTISTGTGAQTKCKTEPFVFESHVNYSHITIRQELDMSGDNHVTESMTSVTGKPAEECHEASVKQLLPSTPHTNMPGDMSELDKDIDESMNPPTHPSNINFVAQDNAHSTTSAYPNNTFITLDQVEVYNMRNRTKRPLLPRTRLEKSDRIQLKIDQRGCWVSKSAMVDLMTRYGITQRK